MNHMDGIGTSPLDKRDIDSVLQLRDDLSPFLVHLTRGRFEIFDGSPKNIHPAKVLHEIITSQTLICSNNAIGVAQYCIDYNDTRLNRYIQDHFLSAISFTETPLNEIHCMLEIKGRECNFEPYGLVFKKEALVKKGVTPVLYFSNYNHEAENILYPFVDALMENEDIAKRILPLLDVIGRKVWPRGARPPTFEDYDFSWEREWRLPYHSNNELVFNLYEDVFVGLCPHNEIKDFEDYFKIPFVDPQYNMKWYSEKLIQARKNHGIKTSVV